MTAPTTLRCAKAHAKKVLSVPMGSPPSIFLHAPPGFLPVDAKKLVCYLLFQYAHMELFPFLLHRFLQDPLEVRLK